MASFFSWMAVFWAMALVPNISRSEIVSHGNPIASDSLWSVVSPDISLEEFQNTILVAGELFLGTSVGKEVSFVFAVTRHEYRVVSIPGEAELRPVLIRLHSQASVSNSPAESLPLAAAGVSSLLFAGMDDLLEPCKHLIFAPDGIFNLTPTTMLFPPEKGMVFSRVPSVSILVGLRQNRSSRTVLKKVKTLAVGGIAASGTFQDLQSLDDTYKGITVIKPNGRGNLPPLDLLGSFDLIHVAAHSRGNDNDPNLSAILLHPTNPDLMIKASDLKELQLGTSMVVLARCTSIPEPAFSGEGIMKLASTFMGSGVPAVVASLWPVDEDATIFFMAAFYESLAGGNNAAGALDFARSQCQNDLEFNQPAHWAGFILVGDSETTIPLQLKPNLNVAQILAALLGALVAIAFMVIRANKKKSS